MTQRISVCFTLVVSYRCWAQYLNVTYWSAAITLYNCDENEQSKEQYAAFKLLFEELDEEARKFDPDIEEQAKLLGKLLNVNAA